MTKRVPVVFGSTDPSGRALPPTVVLNAETVWRVAQIVDRGAGWFRSFGTADEPGPRLASVSGAVHSPGVVETDSGVGVSAAGSPDRLVGGVGIGGLSGGWLSAAESESATWSRAGLAAYGFTPGPGTLHVLGDDECPLRHVSAVLDEAAGESAGQCGPCMFGVPALAEDLGLLAAGHLDRAGWPRLQSRLGLLPGRGACWFPDGVAGYARSALRAFADEVDAHRPVAVSSPPDRGGPMPSPSDVRTTPALTVDRIACTGHGICASLLPDEVSLDEWGYPIVHSTVVDPELGDIAVRLCPARALVWKGPT